MPNDSNNKAGRDAGGTGPGLWFHGLLCEDPQDSAAALRALGVTRLVHGGSADEVAATREAGLEPWVCLGAFSSPAEESHLHCRSLEGEPRQWFGSGCPSHPEIKQRLLDRVREAASWGAKGILLDGIRFASPYEGPDTFLTCTCRWCSAAAADHGYSMTRLSAGLRDARDLLADFAIRDVTAIFAGLTAPMDLLPALLAREPLLQWLRFRSDVICDIVAEVRAALRATSPATQLGAYVFTPSLAPMVGQDYHRLAATLDVIAPMIYRLGDGPACLAPEVRGLASLLTVADVDVREAAVLRALGLQYAGRPGILPGPELAVDAVSIEAGRARSRLAGRSQLVPVLWLDDPNVAPAVAASLVGEPDGVSFYPTGGQRQSRLSQASAFLEQRRRAC